MSQTPKHTGKTRLQQMLEVLDQLKGDATGASASSSFFNNSSMSGILPAQKWVNDICGGRTKLPPRTSLRTPSRLNYIVSNARYKPYWQRPSATASSSQGTAREADKSQDNQEVEECDTQEEQVPVHELEKVQMPVEVIKKVEEATKTRNFSFAQPVIRGPQVTMEVSSESESEDEESSSSAAESPAIEIENVIPKIPTSATSPVAVSSSPSINFSSVSAPISTTVPVLSSATVTSQPEKKWECPVCMCMNSPDAVTCPACTAPKPGTGAPKETTSMSTSTLFKPTTFNTNSTASGGFSFGVSSAAPAATSAPPASLPFASMSSTPAAAAPMASFPSAPAASLPSAPVASLPPAPVSPFAPSALAPAATLAPAAVPAPASEPAPISSASATAEKKWECPVCMCMNSPAALTCPACTAPKPGTGAPKETTTATSTLFKPTTFNTTSTASGGFSFGVSGTTPAAAAPAPTLAAPPAASASGFGGFTNGSSLFSSANSTANSAPKPESEAPKLPAVFSFGSTTNSNPGIFSFGGGSTATPASTAAPVANVPSFGLSNGSSLFGNAAANNALKPGGTDAPKAATPFSFGAPATLNPGVFSFGGTAAPPPASVAAPAANASGFNLMNGSNMFAPPVGKSVTAGRKMLMAKRRAR